MQLVGVEWSDEVADGWSPIRLVGNAHHSQAEPFGVLLGLANLGSPDLDLGRVGSMSLDLDLIHHASPRFLGKDVEPGVVVCLLDRHTAKCSLGGHHSGHSSAIGLPCDLLVHLGRQPTGQAVDEALRDDERCGDDGGCVVDKVRLDFELTKAARLACLEVVGALACASRVEAGLLAVELLFLEFVSTQVPVADLAVEAFLDGASGAFDACFGDVGDLGEVR